MTTPAQPACVVNVENVMSAFARLAIMSLWLIAACLYSPRAEGQITAAEYVYLDFSRLPGSTALLPEGYQIQPNDFAPWGVTVTLSDGLAGFPIVAHSGAPLVAFTGESGPDAPLAPGDHGAPRAALTDPLGPGSDPNIFRPVLFSFSPPASATRICVTRLPISGDEPIVRLRIARNNNAGFNEFPNERFRDKRRGLRGGAWDLPTTGISIVRPSAGDIGFAICPVIVYRLPSSAAVARTGPFVRVAQESGAGAGDFEQGVAGVIRPIRSPPTLAPRAEDIYAYERSVALNNNSYGGLVSEFGLASAQSTFFLADTIEGLSLFVVQGDGSTAGNGSASLQIVFSGFEGPLTIPVVEEEPVSVDASNRVLQFSSRWDNGFTDGFAVAGMNGDWRAIASFQSFSGGLTSWAASSTDGPKVPLALQAGRRVEFRAMNTCIAIRSPRGLTTCSSVAGVFNAPGVSTTSGGAFTYRWQWMAGLHSVWSDITEGINTDTATGAGQPLFTATGSSTSTISLLRALRSDTDFAGIRFRAIVSNTCGTATSEPAVWLFASADFNNDGDVGTDQDIEAFFRCLAGTCCPTCPSNADFNGDGDVGTDADIEAFFRVLAGGSC